MISYERAVFTNGNNLFTRDEFDAAKELWEGLSRSMQLALNEVTWQDALDIARDVARQREAESNG